MREGGRRQTGDLVGGSRPVTEGRGDGGGSRSVPQNLAWNSGVNGCGTY